MHAGQGAGQVPVPHRPDHPGAGPRAGRARVARQRQADPGVPRRRHPAGRRALLLLRRAGPTSSSTRATARTPRPLGVAGAGHPVELPAADAGLEDRPGAGLRQHGGAQARRDHAADRAAVRRDLPAGRSARRAWSTSSPAPGETGARAGRPPGRRQGRVHRLHRGRQADRPGRAPGPARSSPWSWAARPPTSCSTTRRSTRPSRGSSTASSSTRATSAAPGSRLLVQESVHDEVLAALRRRLGTLRLGDPLDKNTDVGAINSRRAARQDPRAVRCRRGRGRGALVAAVRAAGQGLLVRADRVHRRVAGRTASRARRSSGRCCPC